MKLTRGQLEICKGWDNQSFTIPAKYTGWTSKITFSRWQNHGKDRLYYSFKHYNRKGRPSGHSRGKGYIDFQDGGVTAPPKDRQLVARLLAE